MITLKQATHGVSGAKIVEVWNQGAMIATIYPHELGVHIVSKHFPEDSSDRDFLIHHNPDDSVIPVPSMLIRIPQ